MRLIKNLKVNKNIILSMLIIFFLTSEAIPQVTQKWLHRYTGPESSTDTPTRFVTDSSGNFYITGKTIVGGGYFHIITVKYNSSGIRQWITKYISAANQNDEGNYIQTDNSGNVYVFGTTRLTSGQFDMILIKYNSAGVQQWIQQYNGTGNFDDVTAAGLIDTNGDIYIGGYSYGTGTSYDFAIIKYNPSGVQQWIRRWNGSSNSDDYLKKLSLGLNGDIIAAGTSYNSVTSNDFTLLRYNSSGTLQWTQFYNGPNSLDDQVSNMETDLSGNIFVTGKSKGTGTAYDFATVKYNSAGTQQWSMRYNGAASLDDIPSALDADNSGNVYVTGYNIGSTSFQDYLTVKYNSAGVLQWAKTFNGAENYFDRAADVKADLSGNVYVTGKSIKSSDGTSDAVTVKYNSSGNVMWTKLYNGAGNLDDDPVQIEADNTNSVYVLSTSSSYFFSPFCGTSDYLALKYNSSGNIEFEARYDGAGNGIDQAAAMITDNSGNCFVTGFSYDIVSGYDYATIKYNSSGAPVWVSRYDGNSGTDKPSSIASDISGNIYVTGYITGTGTGTDISTVKYNSSGAQQWAAVYNGTSNGDDYGVKVESDLSGNVIVTGYSDSTGTDKNYITLKYNSSGVLLWTAKYNGPGNSTDIPNAMTVDSSGNIFVTGKSIGSGTLEDIATVKYNSSGVQQWVSRYNGPSGNSDIGNYLILDASGNIIVGGVTKSSSVYSGLNSQLPNFDMITIKYNSSGIQQWASLYNGTDNGDDELNGITSDNTGNIYITGSSKNTGTDYDYTTIKYNSSGSQIWISKYNGTSNSADKSNYISSDVSGNLYVTGFCTDLITNMNYCTVKYNNDGDFRWAAKYNYTDNDTDKASVVKINSSGNIFVTGFSKGFEGGIDFCTLQYNQEYSLELKVLIEGFYDNVQNKMTKDSMKVFLRSGSSPYNIIDSALSVVDSAGKGYFIFPNAQSGTGYYLALSHRNSIDTWSSSTVSFQSGSLYYDFTNSISKAYGNNLILKGSRYCLYSGDVNKDGIIDAADISEVDNGTILLLKGRTPTDVNGDDITDVSDLSIVDNNSTLFIEIIRP